MNSNSWIKGFGGANIFHDNRCRISWYIVDIPDIEFGRIVLESEIPLKSEILPPLVARRNVLPDRLSLFCNDVDERLVDDRIPLASSEQYKIAKAKLPNKVLGYFIFKKAQVKNDVPINVSLRNRQWQIVCRSPDAQQVVQKRFSCSRFCINHWYSFFESVHMRIVDELDDATGVTRLGVKWVSSKII